MKSILNKSKLHIRSQVCNQIHAEIEYSAWMRADEQIWGKVWDQAWRQVGAHVNDQISTNDES